MPARYGFLALVLVAAPSFAGPFVDFDFGGTCTQSHSQVIENGDSLSVLLDDFGVNMPSGDRGDGLATRKTCWMRLKVKAPKGHYLAGLTQVFRGGLIKSAGATARLVLRYNLAHLDREKEARQWPAGRAVTPESSDAEFEYTLDDNLPDDRCDRVVQYGVHFVFAAARLTDKQYVLGSLDTADYQVKQRKIRLVPRWKKCR